jgi:hypothetical protein
MKLCHLCQQLEVMNLTPEVALDDAEEVISGHASDLLSDVLAHAPMGSVLVTIQVHMNVIAVAVHAGISAVIFASGLVPEKAVLQKAVEEQIPLFSSQECSFDIAGQLYALGLRGKAL